VRAGRSLLDRSLPRLGSPTATDRALGAYDDGDGARIFLRALRSSSESDRGRAGGRYDDVETAARASLSPVLIE